MIETEQIAIHKTTRRNKFSAVDAQRLVDVSNPFVDVEMSVKDSILFT